ncbi:hypothetical protein MTR_1g069540 [Medicago truncatula]|uniref:Uncharacterized protein n=1 Tax=Medicago truncatula TaxID=3880 RepID=A0A072VWL0_MEDTR|nr:hypothetical protein MTR_1g069540 [Medicago truncatula]
MEIRDRTTLSKPSCWGDRINSITVEKNMVVNRGDAHHHPRYLMIPKFHHFHNNLQIFPFDTIKVLETSSFRATSPTVLPLCSPRIKLRILNADKALTVME